MHELEEPDLGGLVQVDGLVLRLRLGRPSDLPAVLAHADASIWLGISDSGTPERAEFVLSEFSRGGWDGAFGLCRLVVDDRTDDIVAQISLMRSRSGGIEVSYGVAPAYRGRGVATAVLEFVAGRVVGPILDRLEAVIAAKNAASIRVVTKAGFRREGTRAQESGPADLVYVRDR